MQLCGFKNPRYPVPMCNGMESPLQFTLESQILFGTATQILEASQKNLDQRYWQTLV
jgi:hypothetical protein